MAKFKTRARALDMLGRQQIAGIPTAISELFKNAYDAYAINAQVDYYRTSDLFVLSDNGLGMTLDDFENKWLALGTDSKFNKSKKSFVIPKGMKQRPVLGEKGIGRLAISTIGPQVLIMTRAKRDDKLEDLVVSYIHWGVFELPGINLDDIEIPIKCFSGNKFPTNSDVVELIDKFKENITNLSSKLPDESFEQIHYDFENASKSLQIELWDDMLKDFSLLNSSGTQFFIPSADKELCEFLENSDNIDKCSILVKQLNGFFNTMTKSKKELEMKIVFNDHEELDSSDNIFENNWFWNPYDFDKADLYITGTFDSFGFFSGQLRYGKSAKKYEINCNPKSRKTSCEKFSFSLGLIHGIKEESYLTPTEHAEYTKRTNHIGGIYIYRNDIRILPYGIPEFDFLQLERERTNKAGIFWFSHRRVFGAVELTDINENLQEKAGREGFKEGRAYQDLKNLLMTLLKNIMSDMRTDEELSEENQRRKTISGKLKKQKKAIEEQNKKNKELSKEFTKKLISLSSNVILISNQVEHLISEFNSKAEVLVLDNDNQKKYREYTNILENYNAQYSELWRQYDIQKPPGIILEKNLEFDYETYLLNQSEARLLCDEKSNGFISTIKNKISELQEYINKKDYLKLKIDSLYEKINNIKNYKIESLKLLNDAFKQLTDEISQKALSNYDNQLLNFENTLKDISNNLYKENFDFNYDELISYESAINNIEDKYGDFFYNIDFSVKNMFNFSDADNELYTLNDREEFYQSKLVEYKENSEMDFDLVQRGLAVDIINHEFAKEIKIIRHNLSRLKTWAKYNENILDVYQNIQIGFTHLDSYLGLFTQMQRRYYREAIEISGRKINNYLEDVFRESFSKFDIKLEPSQKFLKYKITTYPSTIFPVFVNLVDNALFWVKDRDIRIIKLDIDKNNNFIIEDSGPGINKSDEFRIFERGFSRKELGRGLGLYICKEALKKEGFDIQVDNAGSKGARFVICVNEINDMEEDN